MPNPNHPKHGSSITVQPITNLDDINSIKKLLANNPRDLFLFTLGINNGIRTGDLLKLKTAQLKYAKPGDQIQIKESKTGKSNVLVINKSIYKTLRAYLDTSNLKDDDYLFKSRKSSRTPLTIMTVNAKIKKMVQNNKPQGKLRRTHPSGQNFRIYPTHQIWSWIRNPLQTLQPLKPRRHHALPRHLGRRGYRHPP